MSNSLGFSGVPGCCVSPCPSMPFHKVNICIGLNQATSVRIRQGCRRAPLTSCADIDWEWGKSMDIGLKKCGTVNWNRTVKNGTFINIKFCNVDECTPCATDITSCGRQVVNQLYKFEVDGVDYRGLLEAILNLETPIAQEVLEELGVCYSVGCGASVCCDVLTFTTLGNIPPGAEIVFGPLGVPFPTYLLA